MRRIVVAAALALAFAPTSAHAQDAQGESSRVRENERTATGQKVVANGHVDIGPRFVKNEWTLQVRDDTVEPSVWRNLDEVALRANDKARITVPADPEFRFLGRPGQRIFVLPQVQQQGVLWPGWNTQDPRVADTVRREVTWRLKGVRGPGHFVLFENEEFGTPRVLFDSRRRFPQQTGIDVDTHVHGNWAFSRRGVYRLDVEMRADTKNRGSVAADGTLRFVVGIGDAKAAFADQEKGDDQGGSVPLWLVAVGIVLAAGSTALLTVRNRRR